MVVEIRPADPFAPDMRALIATHLEHARAHSPPASIHTLPNDGLIAPDLAFYGLYDGDVAVGCGALKTLGGGVIEIKSVHVRASARGRGLARKLMDFLIATARRDGHQELVLETGSDKISGYGAARRLYEGYGFDRCGPIPGYKPDPNSAFYRLTL